MGRGALSIAKLCAYASVGRTTVFAEIKAGRLVARKLGRSTVILIEDVDAWLQSLPRVRPSAPDAVVPELPFSSEAKSSVGRRTDRQERHNVANRLPGILLRETDRAEVGLTSDTSQEARRSRLAPASEPARLRITQETINVHEHPNLKAAGPAAIGPRWPMPADPTRLP